MSRLKPAFAKATVPKDGGRLLLFQETEGREVIEKQNLG
jgi:hypothetical protein